MATSKRVHAPIPANLDSEQLKPLTPVASLLSPVSKDLCESSGQPYVSFNPDTGKFSCNPCLLKSKNRAGGMLIAAVTGDLHRRFENQFKDYKSGVEKIESFASEKVKKDAEQNCKNFFDGLRNRAKEIEAAVKE